MDSYKIAIEVFDKEIEVLENVKCQIGVTFDRMLKSIMSCKGKVLIIGMGKSGHIAKKMAASMSSLGTCSVALHPGECMHGDLGMIQPQDMVILISYSGESDEIVRIIPGIKKIGAKLLGITCNGESTLAKACEITQVMEGVEEACHLGLAPTSSTTAVMVYGDALAVAASRLKNFGKDDFGLFHPAGSLGKKLTTRCVDLMHQIVPQAVVHLNDSFEEIVSHFLEVDSDLVPVVGEDGSLEGIITNGMIKRMLVEDEKLSASEFMVHFPYYMDDSDMAIDALKLMHEKGTHTLPIVKDGKPIGMIEKRDILKYGIYI